jgi:membrane protease YdiL (CAAX protease family)
MKKTLQNPYAIAIISIGLFLGIIKFPMDLIFERFEFFLPQSSNVERLLKNFLVIFLIVLAIKKFKVSKLSGLSRRVKLENSYLILIPLYLVIIGVFMSSGTDLSNVDTKDVLLLGFAMLSVGFVEEFVFRGFLQAVFLKHFMHRKGGILIGLFVPALLFGLLHLANLDLSNMAGTVAQVIYAFFIGFSFGVILLRTNKLIPLAIIHGLINFVFSISTLTDGSSVASQLEEQSWGDALGSVFAVLPLFIVSLFILKKVTKESILEKIE